MAKRTRVPNPLHAELTEYSSLLRALRTNDTLDLASQLAQPSLLQSQSSFAAVSTDDEDGENGNKGEGSAKTNVLTSVSYQDAGKQRDIWTRWPLLAGDVHVPEWSLRDEVRHVAEHVLSPSHDQAEQNGANVPQILASPTSFLDPEEDSALLELSIDALTADCAAFLTRILALVCAHVPAAEKSMQIRIAPINWESVVDIACVHGVVSPRVADLVRDRMSPLYPPAHPNISHRAHYLHDMKQNLSRVLSKHQSSLLHVPGSAPKRKEPRKRAQRVSKEKSNLSELTAGSTRKRRRVVKS